MTDQKTTSLSERIYSYLQKNAGEYRSGGSFEEKAMAAGYKSSNASRRLRELAAEGKIESKIMKTGKVKTVFYRYTPKQQGLFN